MERYVETSAHINESELTRDAIREKIRRDAPELCKEMFKKARISEEIARINELRKKIPEEFLNGTVNDMIAKPSPPSRTGPDPFLLVLHMFEMDCTGFLSCVKGSRGDESARGTPSTESTCINRNDTVKDAVEKLLELTKRGLLPKSTGWVPSLKRASGGVLGEEEG